MERSYDAERQMLSTLYGVTYMLQQRSSEELTKYPGYEVDLCGSSVS
jgi:hypothetical protein